MPRSRKTSTTGPPEHNHKVSGAGYFMKAKRNGMEHGLMEACAKRSELVAVNLSAALRRQARICSARRRFGR